VLATSRRQHRRAQLLRRSRRRKGSRSRNRGSRDDERENPDPAHGFSVLTNCLQS
jgi:hypothetical protein